MFSPETLELLRVVGAVSAATRDANKAPSIHRGGAFLVDTDAATARCYIADSFVGKLRENAADNGQIAVTVANPLDHVTMQVKGRVQSVAPMTEADIHAAMDFLQRSGAAFLQGPVFQNLKFTESDLHRWPLFPGIVVTLTIEQVFSQTPGPGAGARIH